MEKEDMTRKIATKRFMRIDAVDGFHSFAGSWMKFEGRWEQMLSRDSSVPVWIRHQNIVKGRAF